MGFLGRTAGWIINILILPLNIYAIMQIMQWDWVKAGVAALILTLIPVIGGIGNMILAAIGAYFIIQNWPNILN